MRYWARIYFWFIGTFAIQQDQCKDIIQRCDYMSIIDTIIYYDKTKSCYFDLLLNTTYERAKDKCEAIGTHLLTIYSDEEQDFVSKSFRIGKEGRWTALEKHSGVWYWSTNGVQNKVLKSKWSTASNNQLTRGVTLYMVWKASRESDLHRFVCKGRFKKESPLRTAHFSRFEKQWLDVYSMTNAEYWTRDAVSCGNVCLQVKCCCGFTFVSSLRKCQLYQKSATQGGYFSESCTPAFRWKCYVRN